MGASVRRFWPHTLIVAAVLLVWGGTVRYDFVWDDQSFVTGLRSIRSLENVGKMFYRLDAQSAVPEEFPLFRPLRTVQYALLFRLGGGEPPRAWLFHLDNVLWHCAAALLLFAVARRLLVALAPATRPGHATLFAATVALAFAVNPVVSETVCWVKSLDDIMAAVFVLASLHQLLSAEVTPRRYWFSVILFALAIYSKVSAGPFPLIAFVVFLLVHKMDWRGAAIRSLPFFVVALVFVVHNHLVIGRSTQTAPISGSYGQTLLDMLPVVPKYIRLLFGIPPFLIDYSYMKGGYAWNSAPVLWGGALLLGLSALAFFALRAPTWRVAGVGRTELRTGRPQSGAWRVVGLGVVWTGVFLIPVSNLLPMMQYMAERFLYLPLIGWCLAAAAALWMLGQRKVMVPVAAAALVFWSFLAWDRSSIWQDNLNLFVRSSQQGFHVERIEQNAVAAILRQPHITNIFVPDPHDRKKPATIRQPANPNDWQPVMSTLLAAYKLFPEEPNLLMALGIAHFCTHQPERAASFFERSAQRDPGNIGAWMNLGRVALDSEQFPKAEAAYRAALRIEPANLGGLRGLADALLGQHKDAEAAAVTRQIVSSTRRNETVE